MPTGAHRCSSKAWSSESLSALNSWTKPIHHEPGSLHGLAPVVWQGRTSMALICSRLSEHWLASMTKPRSRDASIIPSDLFRALL